MPETDYVPHTKNQRAQRVMIYLLFILATIAIILIINGLVQPKTFSISRSISLDRNAEAIYPYIEDLKQWDIWSPWAEKDPGMKKAFSEPSKGLGASYRWHGNKAVGKGQMTITDCKQDKYVSLRLDIETPFEAHNEVHFTLHVNDANTVANWNMSGPQNFFMRAFSVFFNMDKIVGADFEKGLRSLKALVED